MSFARKFERKQQLQEIDNSYCRKCGRKLAVSKGKVHCVKCGEQYGKVGDRI